jgi:hypothetical protein
MALSDRVAVAALGFCSVATFLAVFTAKQERKRLKLAREGRLPPGF